MADFKIAYKKTGGWEGGYSNVASDTGGETYKGISRKWHPKWEGWKVVDKNKPLKRNQIIKDSALDAMVEKFYKKEFWDVISGDSIEDQYSANTLYDFGVNAGHGKSINNIQKVLGLPVTGKISKQLIEAINNPEKYLV